MSPPMTPPTRPLPRRAMLAASGTAVLAVAAACSSGSSGSGTTTSAAATPTTPKDTTSSPAPSSSAATSAGPPPTSAPPTSVEPATSTPEQAPAGTPLASVADVQSAGSVVVEAESGPVLLAYSDGTVVAHTAICTHQQCTIAASGMCPCHGSKFNVSTGAVENGPALRPLAEEPVTVSGGQVYPA